MPDILPSTPLRYIDAYNRFDIDEMVAQLCPDVVFENYSDATCTHRTVGKESFRQQATEAAKFFIERCQTASNWRASDEVARRSDAKNTKLSLIADIHYTATLAIDLPNGARAGSRIELSGTTEFELENGLICKIVDRS